MKEVHYNMGKKKDQKIDLNNLTPEEQLKLVKKTAKNIQLLIAKLRRKQQTAIKHV